MTPKRRNVEFFVTAAAAQQRGYRACKRCRPDASPGSPEWNVRADVVGRAMRLIADGLVDREGVGGLAARLNYSERQVNRLLTTELGAGPLALARAQRAQTARTLIETTSMPITQIAFAAGFTSVRQFNDTIREVFASSPTDLRGSRQPSVAGGTLALRLPYRAPFHAESMFGFLGDRAVPGIETWDGATYRRSLRLSHGNAVIAVSPGPNSAGSQRGDVHPASRQRRRCAGGGAALPSNAGSRCGSRHGRGALRRRSDPCGACPEATRFAVARAS